MEALVLHFGVVNTWNKIFQTEPGTENSYLPALRNANKRLFLYQSMLLLNSNSNMRYYIENHTKLYGEPGRTTNTTVAEWKAAVKKSFGLNYYNDMTLEILEQYATFYWVYELQEQYMYGSSRLGSVQRNLPLVQQVLNSDSLLYYSYSNDSIRYMERGQKRYELSNHLGNVLAVVTDRKLVHCSGEELMWFEAQVVSVTDYYPFGMEIKERSWSVSSYRYGFNGMEKDDEVSGSGNSYTAEYWQYDSRLGRRWNVDPVVKPNFSPFSAFSNNPLVFIDPNGNTDFYDQSGNWVGTDGDPNGINIIITDVKLIKVIRKTSNKGKDFIAEIPNEKFIKLPEMVVVKAIIDVFDEQAKPTTEDPIGGLHEVATFFDDNMKQSPLLIGTDVLRATSVPIPGGEDVRGPETPKGFLKGKVSIHSHPTEVVSIRTSFDKNDYKSSDASTPSSKPGQDLDQFKNYDLNIIVGAKGKAKIEKTTVKAGANLDRTEFRLVTREMRAFAFNKEGKPLYSVKISTLRKIDSGEGKNNKTYKKYQEKKSGNK
jgi:RHS repeat-associated protein